MLRGKGGKTPLFAEARKNQKYFEKSVDNRESLWYYKQAVERQQRKEKKTTKYGGIAQLGERLNGIQEVSGSIPLISTMKKDLKLWFQVFFCRYM